MARPDSVLISAASALGHYEPVVTHHWVDEVRMRDNALPRKTTRVPTGLELNPKLV
jgi:hypothetical protein